MSNVDVDIEHTGEKPALQDRTVLRADVRTSNAGKVILAGVGCLLLMLLVRVHMILQCEQIPDTLVYALAASAVVLVAATPLVLFRKSNGGEGSQVHNTRARRRCAASMAVYVVLLIFLARQSRGRCVTQDSPSTPASESININSVSHMHTQTRTYSTATAAATVSISPTCEALAQKCDLGLFNVLVDGPRALIRDNADVLHGPIYGSGASSLAITLERSAGSSDLTNQTFVLRALDAEIVYDIAAHTAHASFGPGLGQGVVSVWDALGHELNFTRADGTPDGDAKPLELLADGLVLDLLAVLGRERSVVMPYSVPSWDPRCAAFCVDQVHLGRPHWEVLNARVLVPLGIFMLRTYDVHVYQKSPWE